MKELFKMYPCDYGGVTLKGGIAKKQFQEVLSYFMELPEDDILYGFRKRAGLPCRGNELGGWYSNDGSFNIHDWDEIFNTFGQWIGFFAKAYVVTRDGQVYEKLKNLIHEWGKTVEEDGYFFYSRNNNAHHYSYEKMMAGLTDAYIYAQLEEAKVLLDRITEWAKDNLEVFRNLAKDERNTFTGGEKTIKCIDNEWYTLPENLYRAYLYTGEVHYKNFAEKWHYDQYWDAMQKGQAEILKGVHGYSHVNTLCSAAMAYLVTEDVVYLKTIKNSYDILEEYQMMAGGGYAFDEHMADTKGSNYYALEEIGKSFEASCGSYAVLKLTKYLLMFTGEARYADWAERVLYNALFAALPMKDDDMRRGKTFYYADYRIGGGRKVYYEHSFPCCSGTYPQALTEYHNMIYFYKNNTIYLAQYLPSIWQIQGEDCNLRIEIVGNYPIEESVEIILHGKCRKCLCLRVPSWIREHSIRVEMNGINSEMIVEASHWLEIERKWQAGERIKIFFPMHLYTIPITREHPERAALMYGPVMLAAGGKHREIAASAEHPERYIHKEESRFVFYTEDKSMKFRPYWEYEEKEWNTVYLDYSK